MHPLCLKQPNCNNFNLPWCDDIVLQLLFFRLEGRVNDCSFFVLVAKNDKIMTFWVKNANLFNFIHTKAFKTFFKLTREETV